MGVIQVRGRVRVTGDHFSHKPAIPASSHPRSKTTPASKATLLGGRFWLWGAWLVNIVVKKAKKAKEAKRLQKVSNDSKYKGLERVTGIEPTYQARKARAAKLLLEKQAGESLRRVERAGWVVESGRVWLKPALVENGITRRHLEKMLADCQD